MGEQRRHRMYRRLEEVLGEEAAGTLIEHLPRATWADLATKDELRQMEERLTDRFERTLVEKLNQQTRAIVLLMAGLLVSVATLAFAAFKIA